MVFAHLLKYCNHHLKTSQINPIIIRHIPENTYFDMTILIDKILKNGHKVGVYPVSEKSWVDVGQWEEYKKAIRRFKG